MVRESGAVVMVKSTEGFTETVIVRDTVVLWLKESLTFRVTV